MTIPELLHAIEEGIEGKCTVAFRVGFDTPEKDIPLLGRVEYTLAEDPDAPAHTREVGSEQWEDEMYREAVLYDTIHGANMRLARLRGADVWRDSLLRTSAIRMERQRVQAQARLNARAQA